MQGGGNRDLVVGGLISREEGDEVGYAVEWEDIRRRTGREEQNKGDPGKTSEGRKEPQARTSQPF